MFYYTLTHDLIHEGDEVVTFAHQELFDEAAWRHLVGLSLPEAYQNAVAAKENYPVYWGTLMQYLAPPLAKLGFVEVTSSHDLDDSAFNLRSLLEEAGVLEPLSPPDPNAKPNVKAQLNDLLLTVGCRLLSSLPPGAAADEASTMPGAFHGHKAGEDENVPGGR